MCAAITREATPEPSSSRQAALGGFLAPAALSSRRVGTLARQTVMLWRSGPGASTTSTRRRASSRSSTSRSSGSSLRVPRNRDRRGQAGLRRRTVSDDVRLRDGRRVPLEDVIAVAQAVRCRYCGATRVTEAETDPRRHRAHPAQPGCSSSTLSIGLESSPRRARRRWCRSRRRTARRCRLLRNSWLIRRHLA
jgi:hypothetical protein